MVIKRNNFKVSINDKAKKLLVKKKTHKEVIYNMICKAGKRGISSMEIFKATGIEPRQVRDATQRLREERLINQVLCRCGATPYHIKYL